MKEVSGNDILDFLSQKVLIAKAAHNDDDDNDNDDSVDDKIKRGKQEAGQGGARR